MSIEYSAKELAHRLGGASRCGDGWQAFCPAHDDKKPFLVMYDQASGRPRVKCMAGCDFRDVRDALISQGHWTAETQARPVARGPRQFGKPVPIAPVPLDAGEPDFLALLGWQPSHVYRYLDAQGCLLHLIARADRDDGPKDIRPVTFILRADGTTSWAAKAPAAPRPLYGLDLLAQRPTAPVLVVEGEKAADAARTRFRNHVVVTWSGGASAVGQADWSPLRERDVVLWPDNDEAGKEAMARAAAAIKGAS